MADSHSWRCACSGGFSAPRERGCALPTRNAAGICLVRKRWNAVPNPDRRSPARLPSQFHDAPRREIPGASGPANHSSWVTDRGLSRKPACRLGQSAALIGPASLNGWWRITFNLGLGAEKFLAPWLAATFGALIDGVANGETVVAGLALVAGKLAALRTRIKRPSFSVAVFLVKLMLTNNAHCVLQEPAEVQAGVSIPTAGHNLTTDKLQMTRTWSFAEIEGCPERSGWSSLRFRRQKSLSTGCRQMTGCLHYGDRSSSLR